jgi:H+-transporting ATPase
VEALGRVGVVCFDKTGTLSENRLRVTRVETAPGFSREQVLGCAGRATATHNGERHEHATDAAVFEAATAESGHAASDAAHLPFRSGRPFSASVLDGELSVKGAPETVLAACADLDPAAEETVAEMAQSGLRVIAVASRSVTAKQARRAGDDADEFAQLAGSDLRLVGFLGLSDTPRAEAADVLKSLQEQQIGVRLITGDHQEIALADQPERRARKDVEERAQQDRGARQNCLVARLASSPRPGRGVDRLLHHVPLPRAFAQCGGPVTSGGST